MQRSKWLQCMVKDNLFIPIESVDYDCFISTGSFRSRHCDKNTELLPSNEHKPIQDQSYHSTLLLQAMSNESYSYNENAPQLAEYDRDVSDHEEQPFIKSHNNDSEQSTKGASPAVIRNTLHGTCSIENVDEYHATNANVREEEEEEFGATH